METCDSPPIGGHTRRDAEALTAQGIDPELVQARDHAVPCRTCQRPTWNRMAGCDDHYVAPGAPLAVAR